MRLYIQSCWNTSKDKDQPCPSPWEVESNYRMGLLSQRLGKEPKPERSWPIEEDCPIEGLEVIRKQNRVHSLKWSSSVGKESSWNAEDSGSISGLGRSPGEGNGNPLQYSCLEDPMHRETWQAAVHGIARVGHDLVTKPPPPLKWRKWMSEKPWRRWLPAKLGECQGLWLDQFLEGRGLSWSEGGTAEGKSYTSQVTVKSSTWTRRGWLCGAAEIQEPGNQSSEIIGSSWGVRRGHPLWFHSVCEHAHECVCVCVCVCVLCNFTLSPTWLFSTRVVVWFLNTWGLEQLQQLWRQLNISLGYSKMRLLKRPTELGHWKFSLEEKAKAPVVMGMVTRSSSLNFRT